MVYIQPGLFKRQSWFLLLVCDRNMDSGMGQPVDSPKEKVWRVYVRRKKGVIVRVEKEKSKSGSYTHQLVVVNKCGGLGRERAVC